MKSVKVKGLLEEIGTLYEDGALVIENKDLINADSVAISKDIISKLDAGMIVCHRTPCKSIKIVLGDETYETTTATFLAEGIPVQNDEPKLSLHLQKWQHSLKPVVRIPNPPQAETLDALRNVYLKQILAELKIDYLEPER